MSSIYKSLFLKRGNLLVFGFLLFASYVHAQPLSGTYTIPGDYASIAAAVTALNSNGVGGAVTFNVAGGHTENTTAVINVTATGTASNTITFQKSGGGANPLITRTDAGSNTTSTLGGLGDAVIQLTGTDYITFDGIDVTASASTIEYGYFTHKPSATDGCQNVTIKNCAVTMTKGTSAYVMGIYISNGPTAVSSNTGVTVSANSGRNENILLRGNTISGVHVGVYSRGSSASGFYDLNVTVGESGGGNTLQNFGGGSATTSYGVFFTYVTNPVASYNTIDNARGGGSAATSILYGVYYTTVLGDVAANNNDFMLANTSASSASYGIYTATTATSNTFNNNTFGSGTISATGSLYFIYASSATNTVSISGNSTNGTFSRSAASGSLYCYYNLGSPTGGTETLTNNNFSNITVSGSSSLYGLYSNTAVAQNRVAYGNTSANWTGGTGSCYGLYFASGNNNTIYNNTVHDITTGGTMYGLYFSGNNPTVYNNTVYNITTSGATFWGMYNGGTATTNCYKNRIYNLTNNNAAAALYGIYTIAGTANYIYNNFISDLKSPNTSSTTVFPSGIYVNSSTASHYFYIYYNTIFLNGTSVGANFSSNGIWCTTTPTVELRNNVVVNLSTPAGTGVSAAYRRSSTALTGYSSASNNNLFYAGTPSATNLIFTDGTNSDQQMSDYKNRVSPRDAGSVSENPPFINASTAPYNLHMNTAIATQVESGAGPITTPIAVTDDYDGDARNGTSPDIGADEFAGTPQDITAPTIAYTALANTSSTLARTLSATISDGSGVPTSGIGLPRLFWRINAGTWNAVTATHGSGNTYTFSLGSGVVLGDVVEYYVVAQDGAGTPNIGAFPTAGAGGFTANPPAAATPPTTPSQYTIVSSISGTFSVGAGQTYTTLTAAVNDIASKEITGAVTLQLAADYSSASEPAFPVVIPELSGASATNTVTIKPASGVTATITGAPTSSAILKLNGADYIIIDGSNNGTTSRDLTISNTSNSTTSAVIWLASLGANAGATNNTIKNCNIAGGDNTVISILGIYAAGTSISTTGTGEHNNNLTIENNVITKCRYGIYSRGVTNALGSGLVITKNIIGSSSSADFVTYRGIDLMSLSAPSVTQNEIFNMQLTTGAYNVAGIEIGQYVTDAVISRNKIYGLRQTYTSGYGAYGINIASGTNVSNLNINNNVLYDIMTLNYSSSSTTYNAFGIRVTGGTNHKIYYNSINFYGAVTGGTAAGMSAPFVVTSSSATGLDVRNNIFANSHEFAVASSKSYGAYVVTGTTFGTINYNDYYASGTYGILGYYGADKTTLTDWQTASGGDANSLVANPLFNANDNLQPQTGSPVLAAGTPVAGITLDYSGTTRSLTTPSIGAYENGFDASGPNISYTALSNSGELSTRTFSNVAITDPSGVNTTSGTRPRVYYKRSTDANAWNDNTSGTDGWKWVEANGTSSPFTFVIDYAKLNGGTGVAVGNVVQYFVVAQDLSPTPYLTINSGTFAAPPSSVALTGAAFPIGGTVNQYTITGILSGTKTVGSGGDYPSLTGTGGAFAAINSATLTGNLVLNITGDLTEDGTNALNEFSEDPVSSNYTITIQPSAAVVHTISGTYSGGLIRLNGADRITIDGRFSGSGNYLTFSNTSTAASTTPLQIISLGTGAGATNNTIRNCTFYAGANTVTSTIGIYVAGASVSTSGTGADNDNLTIRDNVVGRCGYGIYVRGVATTGELDGLNILNNSVGSTVANDYVTGYGMYLSAINGANVSGNEVYNMIYNGSKYGMYMSSNISNSYFSRNKIHTFDQTNTSAYYATGMYFVASTTTNNQIDNNAIYNLNYYGSTSVFYNPGIRIVGGDGNKLYYNSISHTGTYGSSTASCVTMSVYISTASTNLDIRNNIFYNVKSGVTPKNYAIYAVTSTTFSNINYNDYYTTGSVLGYLGADVANFAAWQAATGQDLNSLNADPLFNSTTNLKPQNGSPVLSAGTPIAGITTDITGVTRSGSTPAIGAYETGGDGAGPVISYTTLLNTNLTANRTLSNVSITDFSSVDFGSNKPRLYYKRSTDASVFGGNTSTDNGWKWTEANVLSSPTNFTFDHSKLFGGSVTTGDIVQYFVVAQDLVGTPNVSASPSSGFSATSVSAVTSAPAAPNSYKITQAPLAGSYTVGTAKFNQVTGRNLTVETRTRLVERAVAVPLPMSGKKNPNGEVASRETAEESDLNSFTLETRLVSEEYPVIVENGMPYSGPLGIDFRTSGIALEGLAGVYATLTAAIADFNERGVQGATTLLLTDNTYAGETYPINIQINNVNATSASNTFTIKPGTGATPSFAGAAASSALINVLGTNYVTVDGSNTDGGVTRDLTLNNTSATTPRVMVIGSFGTTPITNVTVKNTTLINGATSSSALVIGDGVAFGTAGYFSDILVQNNSIQKAYMGVYCRGGDGGAANGTNVSFIDNVLNTSGANNIRYIGIYNQGIDGLLLRGNDIGNFSGTDGEDDKGTWLATGTRNATLERNKFYTLKYTGTAGYGAAGVAISTGITNSNILLRNNFIADISGDCDGTVVGDNVYGVYVWATTTGVKMYNNSIYLSGNTINYNASGYAAGIGIGSSSTADLRNNCIVNNLGLLGATGYGSIGIFLDAANTQLDNSNYNNIYINPTGSGVKAIGQIGAAASTTLADWRTATGKEANSVSAAVTFTSTTDLHLSGGSIGDKLLIGTPLAEVTNDIDVQTRNAYAPYIGADEHPESILALALNLTALIEGFYTPSLEAMIADTMKVYLRSGTNYAKVDSATAVLGTTGAGTFLFKGNSKVDSTYYLVLTHRNSIETWSASAQTFPSGERAYNLTTAASQAYGSNLTLKGTKYCIYGGDVTQDGIVDFSDLVLIDNDQFNFVGGYVVTDITGDDFVDFSDLSLCDNNQFNFISVISPVVAKRPGVIKQLDTKPVIRAASSEE